MDTDTHTHINCMQRNHLWNKWLLAMRRRLKIVNAYVVRTDCKNKLTQKLHAPNGKFEIEKQSIHFIVFVNCSLESCIHMSHPQINAKKVVNEWTSEECEYQLASLNQKYECSLNNNKWNDYTMKWRWLPFPIAQMFIQVLRRNIEILDSFSAFKIQRKLQIISRVGNSPLSMMSRLSVSSALQMQDRDRTGMNGI